MAHLTDEQYSWVYKSSDKEYRANGIYVINGDTYMSLWAFKKRRGDEQPSLNNSEQGKMLARLSIPAIVCKPDYGRYDRVLCYRKSLLEELKFI